MHTPGEARAAQRDHNGSAKGFPESSAEFLLNKQTNMPGRKLHVVEEDLSILRLSSHGLAMDEPPSWCSHKGKNRLHT